MADDLREHHDQLLDAFVRLTGHRRSLETARHQVHDRAREQLDTMPEAIGTVEDHVRRDRAGGILGHRVHRTLLTERARLQNIVLPTLEPDPDRDGG